MTNARHEAGQSSAPSTTKQQYHRRTEQPNSAKAYRFVGIKEASEAVGIAVGTLYKLANRREIPHYKPTGRILFDLSELQEWIKGSKVKTLAELREEAQEIRAIAAPAQKRQRLR